MRCPASWCYFFLCVFVRKRKRGRDQFVGLGCRDLPCSHLWQGISGNPIMSRGLRTPSANTQIDHNAHNIPQTFRVFLRCFRDVMSLPCHPSSQKAAEIKLFHYVCPGMSRCKAICGQANLIIRFFLGSSLKRSDSHLGCWGDLASRERRAQL